MSAFPLPMDLRNLCDGSKEHWVLLSSYAYRDPIHGLIIAPIGMGTDMASVPRWFWPEIDPTNDVGPGAIPHDWLYGSRGLLRPGQPRLTRPQVDDVLYRALRANGVGWTRARIMWAAVRIGGQSSWDGGGDISGLLTVAVVQDTEQRVYLVEHAEPDDAGPERMA